MAYQGGRSPDSRRSAFTLNPHPGLRSGVHLLVPFAPWSDRGGRENAWRYAWSRAFRLALLSEILLAKHVDADIDHAWPIDELPIVENEDLHRIGIIGL